MGICVWFTFAAFSMVIAETQSAPQNSPAGNDIHIVQPGAPGQQSKVLSPSAAEIKPRPPSPADVSFMQGMVMHHSQAVEMTALLRTRSHNKDLLALGERISISQRDEIFYMKQWLEEHGKPVSDEMDMSGMDMSHGDMSHMDMGASKLMPGMLSPAQMAALAKAKGPAFDHLFLTGMIQHHTGALTMVQDLLDTPGAGQDNILFDFATDVDNTQRAEIRIMQSMLKEKQ